MSCRVLLVALPVASTAAFVVGVRIERRAADTHDKTALHLAAAGVALLTGRSLRAPAGEAPA